MEAAAKAITRLKELRAEFRHGWIELEDVKKEAPALIKTFDLYGQAKAKKFGVKYRKFSLSAFLR